MQLDAVCNVRRTGSAESCLIMHRIPLFSRQENAQCDGLMIVGQVCRVDTRVAPRLSAITRYVLRRPMD